VLIRPGNIFFGICVLVWLIICSKKDYKKLVKTVVIFMIGFVIIVSPWLVRNYMLYKRFVFISTMAGEVFYIANHPRSDGEFITDTFRTTQDQKKELKGLDSVERSKKFYQYGWEEIKSNPKRIVRRIFLKNAKFWFKDYDIYYYNYLPHSRIPLVKFNLISFMAAVGVAYLIFTRGLWNFALIFGYIFSYLFLLSVFYFYNGPRGRIEIVTMLCILGAVGLVEFMHGVRMSVRALIKQMQGTK